MSVDQLPESPRYRVGGKQPHNLYKITPEHPEGEPIGHACKPDPEMAALMVEALNELPLLRAQVVKLIDERDTALRERDLAIAHDRQPYPTAWAYEQAVKTIERMRPVIKVAEAWRDWFPHADSMFAPENALIGTVDAYRAALELIAKAMRAGNSPVEDEHPERFCNRCGGPNVHAWSAPSPLWNQVMRAGDINAPEIFGGIVCTVCFAALAEEQGIAELWRFYAERVHVELATVTPSGRVWNPQTWLWEEPGGDSPVESPAPQSDLDPEAVERARRCGHELLAKGKGWQLLREDDHLRLEVGTFFGHALDGVSRRLDPAEARTLARALTAGANPKPATEETDA